MQDLGRNRTFNGNIDGNTNKLINSESSAVYHVNYTIRDGIMKYDPVSAQVLSRCALYTLAHVFVFLLFFLFL